MKLSNIFLSTLAVLLCCTACSKDEESFKGKDADASLSIAVKAVGSAVTKGVHPNDENELAGEAKVNNLSVLVFDESGAQLIGYGWQATNSEGEASILNVPAMTMRAQIVIVSNTPENSLAGVTSYSDFESKLAQLADQSQSNLVMSSPVITTQAPLVKGDNYLGYASMGSENINGIAEPVYAYEGGGVKLQEAGVMFVKELNAPKARLKLLIALSAGLEGQELKDYIEG